MMETFENQNEKVMTVKDWLITLLICAIPLMGLVMLFVYAFGSNENANRQNWAKAQLLLAAIVIGLMLLVFLIFGSIFAATMANN